VGSGTGVVGIAAALLGARVVVTDLPHVLPQATAPAHFPESGGPRARHAHRVIREARSSSATWR